MRLLALLCCAVPVLLPGPVRAQRPAPPAAAPRADLPPPDASASAILRRLTPGLLRIEVREAGSRAKVGVGSGFFATPDGRVVTNYHVISRLVHHPQRHTAVASGGGAEYPLTLLAVDVVHDLAVLATGGPAPGLTLAPGDEGTLEKGTRVLAIGHPQDLGLSIVEGTYNGFVEHAAIARLHYTGPINPGMSGGPAVTDDGRLVGVNVATMGEEVAFLVPAEAVRALLARVPARAPTPAQLLEDMATQLRELATRSLGRLFAPGVPTVSLGRYSVPTTPDTTFRCWGDTNRPGSARYEVAQHRCAMEEQIFLSETLSAGLVTFEHSVLRGEQLGTLRRFAALEQLYQEQVGYDGRQREVTRFRCEDANVRTAHFTWRGALCVRRLRQFPGLYEAVLRAAVLGSREAGLVTSLSMSGVTFDLVKALSQRFLETIGPRP